MRIAISFWLFYQKLVIPSLAMSVLMGSAGMLNSGAFSMATTGIAYMLFAPLFHYFIYEIRNSQEYYFYYNMGLSKFTLWITASLISFAMGLILIVI